MKICVRGFADLGVPIYAGAMSGDIHRKIKAIRQASGLNQTEFAERLGTTQSTVTRWEKSSVPQGDMLHRIADFANTTVEKLLNAESITGTSGGELPVVGYVGAGAVVIPIDDYSRGDGMDTVERPAFIKGQAVAVEVKGDSLLPVAEDGWRLVYVGEQTIVEDEVLNKLCVVHLEDERVLVKRVIRGSKPGHYHLISTNAPIIEDVRITWAAKVKAIIPR